MKFLKFIKDHFFSITISSITYFILLLILFAFKISKEVIVALSFLLFVSYFLQMIIAFFRKSHFYNELLGNVEKLDKGYLVLETIEEPTFYEGKLLYRLLYDINKSMIENIKFYEMQVSDFKEYVEMWIHEVKIPISSLILIVHNHRDNFDKRVVEQIKRLENYVEQVLYYVRSENAEKDYLIKAVSLNKVISSVAMKSKDDLLENKIDLNVRDVDIVVYTDAKWLEFILSQIINNSIKYKRDEVDSYIKIRGIDQEDRVTLILEDNGIGIPSGDIPKVFEKSFTGYNGRKHAKSTGMGLNISKNLCEKLGHKIKIESLKNNYTKVFIVFSKNQYYDVLQ